MSYVVIFCALLYDPFSLEILPHIQGRSAGLGQSIVLLLTVLLIQLVAYFYHGQFMPIGLTMFISIMVSLVLLQRGQINKVRNENN